MLNCVTVYTDYETQETGRKTDREKGEETDRRHEGDTKETRRRRRRRHEEDEEGAERWQQDSQPMFHYRARTWFRRAKCASWDLQVFV